MTNKPPKQSEIFFKPTEFQMDLPVGKIADKPNELQFFQSKSSQIKEKIIKHPKKL